MGLRRRNTSAKATHSGKTLVNKFLIVEGGSLNAKSAYDHAPLHEAYDILAMKACVSATSQ